MPATLTIYRNELKRLLKDSGGEFYGKSDDPNELDDYINDARRRVALDCGIYRQKETVTLLQDQSEYTPPAVSGFESNFNVFRIRIADGQRKWYLSNLSFTELELRFLAVPNYKTYPMAWAKYGETKYIIAPIPDRNYTAELDLILTPEPLTSSTALDTIPYPYASLVKWWGAYLAFNKDKSYTERDAMIQSYEYERLTYMGEQVPFIAQREFYTEVRTY